MERRLANSDTAFIDTGRLQRLYSHSFNMFLDSLSRIAGPVARSFDASATSSRASGRAAAAFAEPPTAANRVRSLAASIGPISLQSRPYVANRQEHSIGVSESAVAICVTKTDSATEPTDPSCRRTLSYMRWPAGESRAYALSPVGLLAGQAIPHGRPTCYLREAQQHGHQSDDRCHGYSSGDEGNRHGPPRVHHWMRQAEISFQPASHNTRSGR
jgi:hypothetical protein